MSELTRAILSPSGDVIPEPNMAIWSAWYALSYDNGSRVVGCDDVQGFRVSTVFLAINHGWDKTPLWFETMVFRLDPDGNFKGGDSYGQWRYTTLKEAKAGHAEICEQVRTGEIGE